MYRFLHPETKSPLPASPSGDPLGPWNQRRGQWQVLHDLVEQLVQPEEEAFIRLEPPPMPKDEINFCGSGAPQSGQTTSLSRPPWTRHSKRRPHFLH
jgi:hypothetical protein